MLAPRIRPVEIIPIEIDGKSLFVIRDADGYASAEITISPDMLLALQTMDGSNTTTRIRELYSQRFGRDFPAEDMEKLIDVLDKHFFFDNSRFGERKTKVDKAWDLAPTRPLKLLSYIVESQDRQKALDDLLLVMNGNYEKAGYPGGPRNIPRTGDDLAGLIAPHIDYIRGGAAYGAAYAEAAARFAGDMVVILGTNHQDGSKLVSATRKNYATPFGVIPTATDLVDELAAAYPGSIFRGERDHRQEHSVELAAAALKHALGDRSFSIVPLLIGSIDMYIRSETDPGDDPEMRALAACLSDWRERYGSRILFLASVDLCHVGKQFGDPFLVDDEIEQEMRKADENLIRSVVAGSDRLFFKILESEKNHRRICGAGAIEVLLKSSPFSSAKVLAQDLWVDESLYGAVGFCGICFHR